MPLKQRVPKLKGFTNPFRVEYSAVNLDTLEELADRLDGAADAREPRRRRSRAFRRVREGARPRRDHPQARRHGARRVEGCGGGNHRRRRYGDDPAAALPGREQGRTTRRTRQPIHEPLIVHAPQAPAGAVILTRTSLPVLSSVKNIFKISDLRNKLLFTVAMVVVYRFGIGDPGSRASTTARSQQLQDQANDNGAIGFLSLFSGGAFESFSIFALGIMPYITSSIIMQILGVVIPKLEELQQQGAVGQRKITQYTRYVTIALATLQATGLVFVFGTGRGRATWAASTRPDIILLPDGLWPRAYIVIPTLVAGTALLMWIGELISQRGIGNGMSMMIFASVVSSTPYGL